MWQLFCTVPPSTRVFLKRRPSPPPLTLQPLTPPPFYRHRLHRHLSIATAYTATGIATTHTAPFPSHPPCTNNSIPSTREECGSLAATVSSREEVQGIVQERLAGVDQSLQPCQARHLVSALSRCHGVAVCGVVLSRKRRSSPQPSSRLKRLYAAIFATAAELGNTQPSAIVAANAARGRLSRGHAQPDLHTCRTGSDSTERIASQLQGPQHRHLLSPKLAAESAALEAAGGIALEPRLKSEQNPEGIYIHGGGECHVSHATATGTSHRTLSTSPWFS